MLCLEGVERAVRCHAVKDIVDEGKQIVLPTPHQYADFAVRERFVEEGRIGTDVFGEGRPRCPHELGADAQLRSEPFCDFDAESFLPPGRRVAPFAPGLKSAGEYGIMLAFFG